MTTPAPVTPERIMQFAWGYVPPLVLEAAIRHRVFDVLDGGPKTIAQVQKETGASERGLTAVMHALVGMDFLAKDKQGLFSLTPVYLSSVRGVFQDRCNQPLCHLSVLINSVAYPHSIRRQTPFRGPMFPFCFHSAP